MEAKLNNLFFQDEFATLFASRSALGNFPPVEWDSIISEGLLKVTPKGLDQVFTQMCGSCANEVCTLNKNCQQLKIILNWRNVYQGALKAAFMAYRARQRGESAEFSAEELSSCMQNQSPGAPDLVALSFNKGFHGRLFGTLSLTRSKAIHKVDPFPPAFFNFKISMKAYTRLLLLSWTCPHSTGRPSASRHCATRSTRTPRRTPR
jgi:4-aminobutyrate aminotransferase-like enzyme